MIQVTGVVQGVGFRPFVYRLATRLELSGKVRNASGIVEIDVEGSPLMLERFVDALKSEAPPRARIDSVRSVSRPATGLFSSFSIETSGESLVTEALIPSDIATCDDCLAELKNPRDRRYAYPFLNCLNCGPRLTIIEGLPYDRERTTLKDFALCEACRLEFENPSDRRFHAQVIACPTCGPTLKLLGPDGREHEDENPLSRARDALAEGLIVAVKGLGGYHLACDATNAAAVNLLRARKRRDEKPFAVMVESLERALALCELSDFEAGLLSSPERPIVLARRRPHTPVAASVFLQSPDLGVLLPYTPLHELLLPGHMLVMTSGNESDCPIAHEDADAFKRLAGIADLFLSHDRPIRVRCDDSVTREMPRGKPHFVRRSRGFAPGSVMLPRALRAPVLAVGAQLKNTFALGSERLARISHHVGDLDHAAAFESFEREVRHYETLFDTKVTAIAHDLHPDYRATRYATERAKAEGLELIGVQHHHAHLASCMAENGLDGPVIGVTFDGTGLGLDGQIWGGEFLVGGYANFERTAHLAYVEMPGGEQAIREPWRMALSHLLRAKEDVDFIDPRIPQPTRAVVRRMIERRVHAPFTSSIGRLFDAVSVLVGIRSNASYEGQAAVELEWTARHAQSSTGHYEFAYRPESEALVIDPAPVISAIVADLRANAGGPNIARRFHGAVAAMILRTCEKIRSTRGIDVVALSGGVFMNQLLFQETLELLSASAFHVHFQRIVPANDGGISLGQLAVAAYRAGSCA